MKIITILFVLAASTSVAGSVTVITTSEQDMALASVAAKTNAQRASRLAEINADRARRLAEMNLMRDADLPPLTASDAGLLPLTAGEARLQPLTTGEVLLLLVSERLSAETKALEAANDVVAVDAVRAIKARAADCAPRATAAGLDPLKVCR